MGFGLPNNAPPFIPIYHQLSPSSHSHHLKISFYFSPFFPLVSTPPVLEWRSFWASYPPPFSPGNPANLSFAPLSILLYFLLYSTLPSSRFVLLFHSPFSYLGPYILLNIFLSKISSACSSFFVIVHVSAPYATVGLISVLYSQIPCVNTCLNFLPELCQNTLLSAISLFILNLHLTISSSNF